MAPGGPAPKPVYLVYGCIHASELSGIHACLHTALRLCAEHDAGDAASLLNRVTFAIIPQISPDGSLKTEPCYSSLMIRLKQSG